MRTDPRIVIPILLLAVPLLVFLPTLGNDFINYDDGDYIASNSMVQKGLSVQGMKWAWTTQTMANWHPLTWMSHQMDCELYGLWAGGHHLTSLMLHLLGVIFLYLALLAGTNDPWASCVVALIYAIHPLHVESVAWASERKGILSSMFWMLSFWIYVKYRHQPSVLRYSLLLISFIAGLLSKQMLVTFPFAMLLIDAWPLRAAGEPFGLRNRVIEKLPLVVIAIIFAGVAYSAQVSGGGVAPEAFSLNQRVSNAVVSSVSYLVAYFIPVGLSVFYPHPGAVEDQRWLVAVVVLVICTTAAVVGSKWRPALLIGWLWYLVTLVPVSGIVQISLHERADRYSDIPLVGITIAMVWGFTFWARQSRYAWALAAVCLALLSVRSFDQVRKWRDSVTLYEHCLAVTEDNFMIHNNLGAALLKLGRDDEALSHLEKSIELQPDLDGIQLRNLAIAHKNLAYIWLKRHEIQRSLEHYNKALEVMPQDPESHFGFAYALQVSGKEESAEEHYREAISLDGSYIDPIFNLAVLVMTQERVRESVLLFERVISFQPDNADARYNAAVCYAAMNQKDRALEHLSILVDQHPGHPTARSLRDQLLKGGTN